MPISFTPLGDRALVARFGETMDDETHLRVRALASHLEAHPFPGMIEIVPAMTTVAVYYDPMVLAYEDAASRVQAAVSEMSPATWNESRAVEIPVCYGGVFGPDLGFVAEHNGIAPEEVVRLHASAEYRVYMIGFAPGFPYLGGMPEKIAAPRRATPRPVIPAGSVGIAGMQTGVYSIPTPGGWQLIGRTPLRLFLPEHEPPSLLRAGDRVRFLPITEEQYATYRDGELDS